MRNLIQAFVAGIGGKIVGVQFALVFAGAVFPLAAQPHRLAAEQALEGLERAAGAPVSATFSPVTGVVSFLSIPADAPVPVRVPLGEPAEMRARSFLEGWRGAFGIRDVRELALAKATPKDKVGMEHVRFQQTHRGVPITGGELTVHLRGNGVVAVNAKTVPGLEGVRVTPAKTAAEASAAARKVLAAELGVSGAQLSEPRLELLNAGLLEGRPSETRLAWFIEARKIDVREYIWIDAASGRLLLHFSQLTGNRFRAIFDADGTYGELPGGLVMIEGQDLPPDDADVAGAYNFSGETYDYFMQEFGRDSYTGTGAPLMSTVRYCPSASDCPYRNAFWNGEQVVFGERYPRSDDVVAHEWTHGFTEHSADLFYYMQSGALNESYSDIFGEVVDMRNEQGDGEPLRSGGACSDYGPGPTGDNSYRWVHGQYLPGGANRDMWTPTCAGDPGKMSGSEFVCQSPGRDRGGVHSNSGVPNHAFALMVDGGSYNGVNVLYGLGLEKAARIHYRALAYYLTSASGFRDDYDALLQSCYDLTESGPIPSLDCLVVKQALDAVEMGEGWPCTLPFPEAAVPDLCPDSQSPSIWHYWDIETSGLPPCPSDELPASAAWCLNSSASVLGSFATSGDKSYWGINLSAGTGYYTTVSTSGIVPAAARMQFNHSHGFDDDVSTFYAGGQVRLLNATTLQYEDGGPLIIAGQAYGGTITSASDNPLGGESAFVGDSWGFTASQLNLSSYAGKTFKYRFQIGTDSGGWDYGWFIDDIRIYTCAVCALTRELDNAYNGVDDEYRASVSIQAGDGYTVSEMDTVLLSAPVVRIDDGLEVRGELTIDNTPCIYLPPVP